jgi:putative membrane protein
MEGAAASDRFFRASIALFVAVALALGASAHYPSDWLLENAMTAVALAWVLASRRRVPLCRASYALMLAYGVLHEIGAHYTYSKVPYDDWSLRLFGAPISESLGFGRNHYDRLVHFLCGVMLFHPLRESVVRAAGVGPVTSYAYPIAILATISHVYELVEWAAAETLGGDLGAAYLGTQGDPWDAQKDMALAFAGALAGAAIEAVVERRRRG